MSNQFSKRALDLIVTFEGVDQPGHWPGGHSGVTIGYGFDLGYESREDFDAAWSRRMSAEHADRLRATIGMHGQSAHVASKKLGDIIVSQVDALAVLMDFTLPAYIDEAREAFTGFDQLPLDTQGALVSLVYNRGSDMTDNNKVLEDRREMRAIRDAIPRGDLHEIAKQLRSMKRLWEGKGLDGLIRRREAEARLVESCITFGGSNA